MSERINLEALWRRGKYLPRVDITGTELLGLVEAVEAAEVLAKVMVERADFFLDEAAPLDDLERALSRFDFSPAGSPHGRSNTT